MSSSTQDRVRVLVVDDSADSANSLAILLNLGYHCDARACTSGEACIETIREFQPHLLFLDLHMPTLTGFEVAKRLDVEGIRPPLVVALSGSGGRESVEMAIDAGCDVHELKPMNFDRLEEIVGKAREIAGG